MARSAVTTVVQVPACLVASIVTVPVWATLAAGVEPERLAADCANDDSNETTSERRYYQLGYAWAILDTATASDPS